MQSGDDASALPLQPVEFFDCGAGFVDPHIDARSAQNVECLFGNLHATVVAGTDNERLGFLGQDGLEVLPRETVSLLTPSASLDMVRKDDHVSIVAAALDVDMSETIPVDMHGSIYRLLGRWTPGGERSLPYGFIRPCSMSAFLCALSR